MTAQRIDLTGKDLAAMLRLHAWLSTGIREIVRACDECDYDRAFALISLVGDNPSAREDQALVDDAADRLSPLIFGHTGEERREAMKAKLEAVVGEILAGMGEEEARRPRGLPS